MFDRLLYGIDWRNRDAGIFKKIDPVQETFGGKYFLHFFNQNIAVNDASRIVLEATILKPVGPIQYGAAILPEIIAGDGEHEVTVIRRKNLIGHDARMLVAKTFCIVAAE